MSEAKRLKTIDPEVDEDKHRTTAPLIPDSLNKANADRMKVLQQQLKELTRTAKPINEAVHQEESYKVDFPCRRILTEQEKEQYKRDGFLLCQNWFTSEEVNILAETVQHDSCIDTEKIVVADAEGKDTKLTLWWYLGDDTYGQFGRSAGLVQAASDLMGGSEPYHSHSKVLLKEPRSGGAWEWHQDFGYWYSQGLLHPDKIVNAIVAIDPNTSANGCMRLVRCSHTLGRIEHGTFGGQAGADPERVVAAMKLPGYDVVELPIMPGDVAFMHSNTLHASSPNLSDDWRRNIIIAYNSRENEPLDGSPEGQPAFNPIKVVSESSIVSTGVKGLAPHQNKMHRH